MVNEKGEQFIRDRAKAKADSNGQVAPNLRERLTWANKITPEPVRWAWIGDFEDSTRFLNTPNLGILESSQVNAGGRIAVGTVAIGAGTEGIGKSSFGIHLAALVSTGKLHGVWYGTPRRVIFVAVEDSWKYTIVPRLMAAGADLSRVARFDVVTETSEAIQLSLPSNNSLLERSITENDIALVLLDPMLSLISEDINTHHEREARQALDPLVGMAERTSSVIYGVAHFNKGSGSDISARITGSGAFKNVPRAVFGFANDPDSGNCVITQSKNSLGRSDLPSLMYRMEPSEVQTPTGPTYVGRFVPLGLSQRSVTDILATGPGRKIDDDEASDGLAPAQRFIIGYIKDRSDANGEVFSRDVITAGEPVGFTETDLTKARTRAKDKIATRKSQVGWMWSLTSQYLAKITSDLEDSKIPGDTAPKIPSDLEDSKIPQIKTFKADLESSRSASQHADDAPAHNGPPGQPGNGPQ